MKQLNLFVCESIAEQWKKCQGNCHQARERTGRALSFLVLDGNSYLLSRGGKQRQVVAGGVGETGEPTDVRDLGFGLHNLAALSRDFGKARVDIVRADVDEQTIELILHIAALVDADKPPRRGRLPR